MKGGGGIKIKQAIGWHVYSLRERQNKQNQLNKDNNRRNLHAFYFFKILTLWFYLEGTEFCTSVKACSLLEVLFSLLCRGVLLSLEKELAIVIISALITTTN